MSARAALIRGMKVTASAGDFVHRPKPGVVVLIYHRVGATSPSEIDMPTSLFAEQMAWLAESGRAVSLDRALDLLEQPDGLADRRTSPVVVTFDDGTTDLAEIALPILVEHQIPATVYLATRFADEGIPWGANPALTWEQAQEMASTGLVQFGSHTHGHVLLDRVSTEDAGQDLDRSKKLIEDHLQTPADHFAYPKAVAPSPGVEALVRARFRSAALAGNKPNQPGRTDPHRLARTAIQVSDGQRYFQKKVNGGMALEGTLRYLMNRPRYRTRQT